MRKLLISCIASAIAMAAAAAVSGQGVPAPYTPRLQTMFTGLSRPIMIKGAGDGSRRLFVLQQGGLVRVIQPGSTTATTFIDLTTRITVPTSGSDERGLLGLAFHPQFATNGKFYCFFNRVGDSANTLVEYTTTTGNGSGNTADVSSERLLFAIPDPFSNHNGGNLEFGPDGFLYIGTGDGGSANDPGARAQNRQVLLGKILRIDVNSTSPAYAIPPGNPFTGAGTTRCDTGSTTGTGCQEIWAYGMRNPWRWSFDRGPGGTNQMFVADVGQGSIEELDIITAGGNYGWRAYEGTNCTNLDPALCTGGANPITHSPPFYQYSHVSGRCSVTGGYVYRGTQGNLPTGAYIYADYCTGEIWMYQNSANPQVLIQDTPRLVTSFGQDEDGEIYVCYSNGQIDKIVRSRASADLDGDFKTDVAVYRPNETYWYVLNSSNGSVRAQQFGIATDVATPEDFDGDSITDIGVFRPSNGVWFYLKSTDSTWGVVPFGTNGDVPAAGDFDGDAKADPTVYRPSNGAWYTLRSSDNGFRAVQFGTTEDIPQAGDYDGDGKYDICVFRPSNGVWYRLSSMNNGFSAVQFGTTGDVPSAGDVNGDGRLDNIVFRPSQGVWYSLVSLGVGFQATSWGTTGDLPVMGDYDGDGRDDYAVFRPSNGVWYILRSSNGSLQAAQFGTSGDAPAPRYDIP